jgi:hypothetical protein
MMFIPFPKQRIEAELRFNRRTRLLDRQIGCD